MTSLICELDARGGRHQEEKDEGAALRPRQSGGRLEKAAEEEEAHEVVLCLATLLLDLQEVLYHFALINKPMELLCSPSKVKFLISLSEVQYSQYLLQ